MSGDDVLKYYGNLLSVYEREEVKQYETIYYLSFNRRKPTANTTSYSMEHQQDSESNQTSNNGYDND